MIASFVPTILIDVVAFFAALVVSISVTYILIKIVEKCFEER